MPFSEFLVHFANILSNIVCWSLAFAKDLNTYASTVFVSLLTDVFFLLDVKQLMEVACNWLSNVHDLIQHAIDSPPGAQSL